MSDAAQVVKRAMGMMHGSSGASTNSSAPAAVAGSAGASAVAPAAPAAAASAAPANTGAVPSASVPATTGIQPVGIKGASAITPDGELLFTLEQALDIFNKAAGVIVAEDKKMVAKSAAYEESVERVVDLLRKARDVGNSVNTGVVAP